MAACKALLKNVQPYLSIEGCVAKLATGCGLVLLPNLFEYCLCLLSVCVLTYQRVYCLYGFQLSIRDAEHTRMFQRITAHCQRRLVCDTWHNQRSLGNDAHVQSRAHTYEGLNLRDLRLCWLPIMCAV